MTARLVGVLKAIEELLTGVTFRMGAKLLSQHDRPPRIVWVLARDLFAPATKGGTNPRSLRTRLATVEAHVWGASIEQAEQLLHNLVVAIHRVAHGSYELRGTSWEKPMWMEHGEACTLTFELAIPITTEIEPIVVVNETAVEQDPSSASDGVRA